MNLPDARQDVLRARLERGQTVELAFLAEEFGVSVDTVRRDLKLLEMQGVARCVRGGAMPVARPALQRMAEGDARYESIAACALSLIEDGMVLFLDGGSTVLALAQALPPLPNALAVTPAPAVALACLAAGVPTHLVGGRLSALGAVCVGHGTVSALSDLTADLAFLGVCGLEETFGLSADDPDEAFVKRAMAQASGRTIALTSAPKLGRKARHRVLPLKDLDMLITDAPPRATRPFTTKGLEVRHA
ncbi:DeoR/GlpR family DNA-binding transcription regulator [Falsirhodobacter sp. 20TX0035]|uniref:DeoR/GlpR family DNA-binding transcription regulator n=1 Tax=Falsirhodobacter sp. 20TX0035 TaxID=3022019 RepID=UPI00232DC01B|nr:DeoR/GlpR family DNA-binding transcription regulator [Falsirhodobacter sp. 20TX0035]MDB6452732.1 DeoR/GlpR family DNA-binding transcription regulator [Falsirhodobacter sp. 20TX0035]